MKKTFEHENEDDLRDEYDFSKLQVVARGSERRVPNCRMVELAPDVAEIFPDSVAVNEALRFLIRITQDAKAQEQG